MSDVPPPGTDERAEWMFERGRRMEALLEEYWIENELRQLWENPGAFEAGAMYDESVAEDERLYALLRLGILFGIDYEREYPTGMWRAEE